VCIRFFREVDDKTIRQNAAPVLNSLKELQFVLSQGESNQFGTVPLQARVEMLVIQELLGADEIQRFLGPPLMSRYPQPWMGSVDTLRRMLRWGDTSIVEFYNLALAGEEILFTVRFGNFDQTQTDRSQADVWARALRNQIEQYVHSYRAVTGVDVGAEVAAGHAVDATLPSVYLKHREAQARTTA
jgi:hypothetical protein